VKAETSGGWRLLAIASVADLPSRPHARVAASASLAAVVEAMRGLGRGCAVIEDGGAVVGIFTERDLINRVDRTDPGWRDRPVRAVMTPRPLVVRSTDSLADALRQMTTRRLRHLPIVDDGDHVRGLVSVRDVLAYIAGRFPEELMNLPPDPSHES
jgi:signal-transduction protein with cAMP-binding, CBS, and nucleotidyltransferase domain